MGKRERSLLSPLCQQLRSSRDLGSLSCPLTHVPPSCIDRALYRLCPC